MIMLCRRLQWLPRKARQITRYVIRSWFPAVAAECSTLRCLAERFVQQTRVIDRHIVTPWGLGRWRFGLTPRCLELNADTVDDWSHLNPLERNVKSSEWILLMCSSQQYKAVCIELGKVMCKTPVQWLTWRRVGYIGCINFTNNVIESPRIQLHMSDLISAPLCNNNIHDHQSSMVCDLFVQPVLELTDGVEGSTSPFHVYRTTFIFEWKSVLNFNPCSKFQSFRHLMIWAPVLLD